MIRVVLLILASLLAGAIIHIATIFAIPFYATNDIWHRALNLGPMDRVQSISDPKKAVAISPDLDPTFTYGLCRTDVSEAPTLLQGRVPTEFWSLNYLDRRGRSQFSLTNQNSGKNVNVVLASKGHQRLLAEKPDLIDETTIVITATEAQGLLVLRSFVGSERDRKLISDAVSRLNCGPLWEDDEFE